MSKTKPTEQVLVQTYCDEYNELTEMKKQLEKMSLRQFYLGMDELQAETISLIGKIQARQDAYFRIAMPKLEAGD